MIKAVVFDYNGVIINDYEYHEKAFKETLRKNGIGFTDKKVRELIGPGTIKFFELIKPDASREEIEKLVEEKTKYYRELAKEDIISEDVKKTLIGLKKKGIKLGLLTHSSRKQIDDVVDKKTLSLFDIILAEEDLRKMDAYKPKKEGLLYITKYFDCGKKETLFVGDMLTDALTAKNAGIRFVFINSPFTKELIESRKLAFKEIKKLSELFHII